jgi:hypothetical protein
MQLNWRIIMKNLKGFNYCLMGIGLLSCNLPADGNSTRIEDEIILQADNEKVYEVLHELQADLNNDGKIDLATIENHNDTIYFNIFESGQSTATISNDKVIFGPGYLVFEGMHNIDMTYNSTKKSIYIVQEFGSVRPDGFYQSWFIYKQGTYWVDSIALNIKEYDQDPVSLLRASVILNKKLEKINLIEEFDYLKIEN